MTERADHRVCSGAQAAHWPDAVLLARLDELGDDVLAVRRVHHAVIGELGVPEAKAALVVRREADLARAERHGRLHPLVRREVCGVEGRRGDARGRGANAVVLDARPRVDGEMHELGEAHFHQTQLRGRRRRHVRTTHGDAGQEKEDRGGSHLGKQDTRSV